ncbi:hypothetical protein [Paraburkholderia humisilvae]|uniref:Uncharacterized protein n=1 Tax=Paraburkholderia humisilvae TaxID=627669 RepID=A0A6J5DJZ7_9BURK|nr:hypothetical protein [Paraburkholderia humisilvae]CAB3754519.1 hypothetical protein LMG29542_02373 [Paraburkholderia humisilvae]
MSKQINPQQLAEIVAKLLTGDAGEVDSHESFSGFMTGIANVVCDFCGGEVVTDAAPLDDVWYVAIRGNQSLPDAFGGIWREVDPGGDLFVKPENSGQAVEANSTAAPVVPVAVSQRSTFAADGYRHAKEGLPASQPAGAPSCAAEYLAGYREAKRELAQAEFEKYDFGDGVFVHDHDLWEIGDEADYTRIAYLEYPEDAQEADLHKVTFHVRFNANGTFSEVYALEVDSGNLIGIRTAREEAAVSV